MTTATSTQPVTASVFLFGDNRDSVKALAEALDQHGVVGSVTAALTSLSRVGRAAVGKQIATVGEGLLALDLGDLIAEGWRKFEDLTAAAKRTMSSPGSSELVDLAAHTISSKHSPRVEMLVNDAPVATVQFDLSFTFTIKGMVATVRGGRLVELHAGVGEVEGKLEAQGRELAKRQGHFELPWLVRVGDGIPLVVADQSGAVTIVDPAPSVQTSAVDPTTNPAPGLATPGTVSPSELNG